MTYHHRLRIRYADCDMQGVVHNSHYLTFIDDGVDCWLRELGTDFEAVHGWDIMLKRADITWVGPARLAEHLDIECWPSRWGNTSFDVSFGGSVGEREVFTATVTYVTVDAEQHRPCPVPAMLRDHLTA